MVRITASAPTANTPACGVIPAVGWVSTPPDWILEIESGRTQVFR